LYQPFSSVPASLVKLRVAGFFGSASIGESGNVSISSHGSLSKPVSLS
jgi:hypothetical protein